MVQAPTEDRQIQQGSEQAVRDFPALWRRMANAWAAPGGEPRAWLMYSASYVLRTGGLRWAIDPVRLRHRLVSAPSVDYATGLQHLSPVLLTHQHGDHLDLQLLRALRHLPITWVVPEPLLARVRGEAAIAPAQVLVPKPLEPIDYAGIRITPFDGMHWENHAEGAEQRRRGVASMGYLVEYGGRRWLFPGDTRRYVAGDLPAFGPVDELFAHVWLGRAAARQSPPPLLKDFCRWCMDLSPARVVLAHLNEFGRDPEDYWSDEHARLVVDRMRQLRPELPVTPLSMGSSIEL